MTYREINKFHDDIEIFSKFHIQKLNVQNSIIANFLKNEKDIINFTLTIIMGPYNNVNDNLIKYIQLQNNIIEYARKYYNE